MSDLIYRQDAYDCINKLYAGHTACNMFEALDAVAEYIEELPSADACENASEITRKSNATDLISRRDALNEIKARFEDAREWYRTAKDEDIKVRAEATIMSFTECSLMLKKLPSAESEIIRCKDCKHYNKFIATLSKTGQAVWDEFCEKIRGSVTADDFCSYAERRTDE